ncbi:hypothetical protein PL79_008080 [Burkholderia sp. USMB20]|nr:hypothetical protein PL79_008080 [Burkholderia sp. USMB20]
MRAMRYRHSRRRRIAPRRRVNRFTGFISEPSGRFVSQRICVRVRHTAIQNRGGNGCSRSAARDARHEPASLPARVFPSNHAYARRNGRNPARTSRANSSGSSQAAKCPPLSTSLK